MSRIERCCRIGKWVCLGRFCCMGIAELPVGLRGGGGVRGREDGFSWVSS